MHFRCGSFSLRALLVQSSISSSNSHFEAQLLRFCYMIRHQKKSWKWMKLFASTCRWNKDMWYKRLRGRRWGGPGRATLEGAVRAIIWTNWAGQSLMARWSIESFGLLVVHPSPASGIHSLTVQVSVFWVSNILYLPIPRPWVQSNRRKHSLWYQVEILCPDIQHPPILHQSPMDLK